MINILDIFEPKKVNKYAQIANFLKKDAKKCFDGVVGGYVKESANKIDKAIKVMDPNERIFNNGVLFPNMRINKYKAILNFLDYDFKRFKEDKKGKNQDSLYFIFLAKAGDNLEKAINYLEADCMEERLKIV